jgi:type I restriction enzyme S subunit
MSHYRLRHLVRLHTAKTDVSPATGRLDLEDLEAGTSRIVTDPSVQRGRTGDGVAFQPGDVLFSKLRPYLRKSLLATYQGCCSPELLVMRPDETLVDPRFVAHLLHTEPFIGHAVATSKGVKMPRTSFEALGEFRVELPDLASQRSVASYLDRELARLQRLTDRKRRSYNLVQERFQALNDSLVYTPGDDTLELIPLMHLVDDARPVMYGIVLPGPDVGDGVLLVKGGDVEAGHLDPGTLNRTAYDIEEPYARSRLEAGDLLVSIRGSFGAVARVPQELAGANITQDAARVAPAQGTNDRWLFHALRSNFVYGQLHAVATGAGVRGVNIRDLKRVRIPVPDPARQAAVAAELDSALDTTMLMRRLLQRQLDRLQERRRSLITGAFAGDMGSVDRELVPA